MKKIYNLLILGILAFSIMAMPIFSFAQEEEEQAPEKKTRQEKRKAFDDYLFINANIGVNLNHTDVSDERFAPPTDTWRLGYGGYFGWQFAPIWGVRGQLTHGKLYGEITDEWLLTLDQGADGVYGTGNLNFKADMLDYHIDLTINLSNLISGYNPDRLVNIYAIGGVGASQWRTESFIPEMDDFRWRWNGIKGEESVPNVLEESGNGEKDGFGERTMVLNSPAGLGIGFNLNEHWDITFESILKFVMTDRVDTWKKGEMAVKADMYSYTSLGVTYKFAYGNPLKKMENNYETVEFTAEPKPLEAHGGKVPVKITGTFQEKYFHPKAAMEFTPVLKYEGGSVPLKTVYLKGEDVGGEGILIPYDGGTFTYEDVVDYTPELRASELVVSPTIFLPKENLTSDMTLEQAKQYKYITLAERKLDDGVIITPTRVTPDRMSATVAAHGYVLENILTQSAKIFFEVNRYNLNWNLPLNKLDANKKALADLMDFIALNYKVKDINIDGWASPEGEETFNQGLSENRSKTAYDYLLKSLKKMVKDEKLTNIADAEKDLKYNLAHHGPDWNGFLSNVQKSDIKDKNIILNVINSAATPAKKEQEIRNMIVIYPELEEKMLPPLRRAELVVNCYEPKKTKEEIAALSTENPALLDDKELLYSATLTDDVNKQHKIYMTAINSYPDNYKGYLGAASCEIQLGDLNAAQSHLDKAVSLEPNSGEVYNNLGIVAAMKKDYVKAEEYFTKAKQLGQDENYNLAVLEIIKGDYSKAISMFGKTTCDYNLALAYVASKDYMNAQKTLECAPKDAPTYYLMAIVGARTNNTSMLFENLTKAVQEDAAYKDEAKIDREFLQYFEDPNFIAIVK